MNALTKLQHTMSQLARIHGDNKVYRTVEIQNISVHIQVSDGITSLNLLGNFSISSQDTPLNIVSLFDKVKHLEISKDGVALAKLFLEICDCLNAIANELDEKRLEQFAKDFDSVHVPSLDAVDNDRTEEQQMFSKMAKEVNAELRGDTQDPVADYGDEEERVRDTDATPKHTGVEEALLNDGGKEEVKYPTSVTANAHQI